MKKVLLGTAVTAALMVSLVFNLAAAPSNPASAPYAIDPRIVGGTEAAEDEFPYIVALVDENVTQFCGGTLINPLWVLTAAHCIDTWDLGADNLFVLTGAHTLSTYEYHEMIGVTQIILHPGWDTDTADNDIALLKLESASTLAGATLYGGQSSLENQSATVAGWGRLAYEGASSDTLMKVTVPVVSNQACSAAYPGEITENMLCAGLPAGGKDSCQGDSGGPLYVEHHNIRVLAGIVSWGIGCAWAGYYGVYARLSTLRSFIDTHVSNASYSADEASPAQSRISSLTCDPTFPGLLGSELAWNQDSCWISGIINADKEVSASSGVYSDATFSAEGLNIRFDPIDHEEYAIMETLVQGPGRLRYKGLVSSEENYDFFEQTIDGYAVSGSSGNNQTVESGQITVPAGYHYVGFRYRKDGSNHVADDTAWVGQVEYLAGDDELCFPIKAANGSVAVICL